MRTAAQAVAAAKASKSNIPKECLNWCWEVYGEPAPRVARWASAADAWALSKYRHTSHWTEAPVGALIYLGARPGSPAGDVFIKTGADEYWASDIGSMGHPGRTTVAAREVMTGREYVGWMPDVLGNPIDFGTTTAAVKATRITEDDMPTRDTKTITRTTPQPVPKAWDWLRLNDAGDVSLAIDKCIVDATVYLQFHGLPTGRQVQARFVRSNTKDSKRNFDYPVVEISGTSGDTFGQITGNFELADGDRLRLKILGFDDGVTVAAGYAATLVWK